MFCYTKNAATPRFKVPLSKEDKFFLRPMIHDRHNRVSLHGHNFAEIKFVEEGIGYHFINGKKEMVGPGSIIFIRPEKDEHTMEPASRNGQLRTFVVAFEASNLNLIRKRYFPKTNEYFWSDGELPHHLKVDKSISKWTGENLRQLMNNPRSFFHLDRFLLSFFNLITEPETPIAFKNLPPWLIYALNNFKTPEHFSEGIEGFSNLANRTPEHICRTLRKHLNKTLSEVINHEKIKYAEDQLILSEIPISSISMKCGFENLGYFYTIFKKNTGMTPAEYRRKNKILT